MNASFHNLVLICAVLLFVLMLPIDTKYDWDGRLLSMIMGAGALATYNDYRKTHRKRKYRLYRRSGGRHQVS